MNPERSVTQSRRLAVASLLSCTLFFCHAAAADSGGRAINPDNPNAALYPVASHPFGVELETWSENFWRWLMSVPLAQNPNLTASAPCESGQTGPVFFIPASAPGTKGIVRTCTVDEGKAIGINLSSYFNDYPCPDPSDHPAPGQSLFDFLVTGAVDGNNDIVTLETSVDGVALQNLFDYRFTSDALVYFKGDPSLQGWDSCITGSPQPAANDAYFLLLKPLAPGHHVITRKVVNAAGHVFGPTTVNVEVVPRRD